MVDAVIIAILFIPFILSVILFFKVWGMTNNVRDIKGMIQDVIDVEYEQVPDEGKSKKSKKLAKDDSDSGAEAAVVQSDKITEADPAKTDSEVEESIEPEESSENNN